MTPEQFDRALSALGYTGVDLARRLSVTPRAVSLWRTGKRKIPGPVAAYLELAAMTSARVVLVSRDEAAAAGIDYLDITVSPK